MCFSNDTERSLKKTRSISKGFIILSMFVFAASFACAADNDKMPVMPQQAQGGMPSEGAPAGGMPPGRMPAGAMPGSMEQQNIEVPENVQLDRDIVYATMDGHELKLDIAYPKDNKGNLRAVVYFHGGGWEAGDKEADRAITFAKNGLVGIAIQYRLSGVAQFPAAVNDCKTAVRWTRVNAKKYGINPDKIGVMGESAGGHLAALVGMSNGDSYLEGNGPYKEYSSNVQAVVDCFGPTDLTLLKDSPSPMKPDSKIGQIASWLGKSMEEAPEIAKKANPITYIDPKDPPVLILHGEEDNLVPMQQSEIFYDAMVKAGVKTKFVRVKNAGHGFRDSKDAPISPSADEVIAIQMNWFKEMLK